MTDADLIAQYLAQGGEVQKCPPRTFSTDPSQPYSWRKGNAQSWKVRKAVAIAAERRREATAKIVAEIPVGQVARPDKKPSAPRVRLSKSGIMSPEMTRAVDLIKSGKTTREVAEMMGIKAATLHSRLQYNGIRAKDLRPALVRAYKSRKYGPKHTDDQIRDAVATRTQKEAAEFLVCDTSTLRKRMKALGITAKAASRKKGTSLQPLITLIESGKTLREIAAMWGVHHSTIASQMKRADITVTSILEAYHMRKYGHTKGIGNVKLRGAKNQPKPFCAGGYEWPDRRTASAELRVHYKSLGDWTKPDAKAEMRGKLAAAIEAWVRRSERVAA